MANKQKAHIHSQAACTLWHSQGKRNERKKNGMKTTKTGDNFVIIHFIRCMYLDIHIKSVVCSLSHCQQMNKHSTTKRER